MKTILNLLWLVTGGLWLSLSYALFGLLACIPIITAPIGVASLRMARYALWPFGRRIVERTSDNPVTLIANVIWFLCGGMWLALGHLTTACAQAVTIVGIPLAIANVKMIPVTCFPYGKQVAEQ
ncbi:YccF domain-containing protein [Corynebacterium choanae]|uniref:Inner membrane protein YccF n=1 Tax=Corynebacterium choanae TaxID=1862358 RepID=A0A3G6J9D2_9CORY|nr:YccF domain-containing protein [Corynebacterium choanae]AZA13060.1 Inner membrane protein YccF [Corynebacterium choanae]